MKSNLKQRISGPWPHSTATTAPADNQSPQNPAGKHRPEDHTRWARGALLALVLIATALRFGGLGHKDLWIDESFSLWMAQLPRARLVETTATLDHHPPLYYLLLRGWQIMTGEREYALRMLSAWLGVATIPLFFALSRDLLGDKRALAATILLVCAPFHVAYAQEARMYTLLGFTALLTLWLALESLRRAAAGRLVWRGALWAIAQTAVMLSHNTAVLLFPIALNLTCFAIWSLRLQPQTVARFPALANRVAGRNLARLWLGSQVGAFVLWAILWLPAFIGQAQTVDRRFWVEMPTAGSLWLAFQSLSFGHPPAGWTWGEGWVALFICAALLGVWRLRRQRVLAAVLVILWLAGAMLALGLSLRRPIFLESTLIWTTFAYYMLLAAGVVGVTDRPNQARVDYNVIGTHLLGALLLVGMLGGLWGHYTGGPKEEWRAAAAIVAHQAEPTDLVLFHASWAQLPFLYYADYDLQFKAIGTARRWETGGIPSDLFTSGELEPEMLAADVPDLRRRIADRGRVWLIHSHAAYSDPAGLVPETLHEVMEPIFQAKLTGVEVVLFERRTVR